MRRYPPGPAAESEADRQVIEVINSLTILLRHKGVFNKARLRATEVTMAIDGPLIPKGINTSLVVGQVLRAVELTKSSQISKCYGAVANPSGWVLGGLTPPPPLGLLASI